MVSYIAHPKKLSQSKKSLSVVLHAKSLCSLGGFMLIVQKPTTHLHLRFFLVATVERFHGYVTLRQKPEFFSFLLFYVNLSLSNNGPNLCKATINLRILVAVDKSCLRKISSSRRVRNITQGACTDSHRLKTEPSCTAQ